MGMGGYGFMPMQQPSRPNMGKGSYYPGMGYLPEARNEFGTDFFEGTSLGEPIGPDRREQAPRRPDASDIPPIEMQQPSRPTMGKGYGLPFGGMPFYGGLGGFLGGGFDGGFGGGPMYGGFRRRFDPYQSMMPQQQEYTPPTQETMTPLLEEFTNFYLNDFQKRNPPTQRSSTMRSTRSPYGIGSLFGRG